VIAPPSFRDEVIAPLLAEKGWEQKELAEYMGIDKSAITHWNKGGVPSEANLEKLAKVCKLDVEKWKFMRQYLNFINRCHRLGIEPGKYLDEN